MTLSMVFLGCLSYLCGVVFEEYLLDGRDSAVIPHLVVIIVLIMAIGAAIYKSLYGLG